MGYLVFFTLAFFVISFCVGYAILWLFGSKLVREKQVSAPKEFNPYIEYHIRRRKNDANYEEYLEWMDKNNYRLPVDKVMTEEEFLFYKEINEL